MNLYSLLMERQSAGRPIKVGLVGAGKFATMFFSQALRTPGMRLCAVCDLDLDRARQNLLKAGFKGDQITFGAGESGASITLTDRLDEMLSHGAVDVLIESTGDAVAGCLHALKCIEAGVHVVMVNVEADALLGPILQERAARHGVIYSLAYGDQPALIAELVDMVRTMGFDVIAAGKGTKYLPSYHDSTPETVWTHYGISAEDARRGGMNSTMFNSFLDGTKSAIEMAAVANACDLRAPDSGLRFPPCSVDDLPTVLRPVANGGVLAQKGMVEVISSLHRDGTEIERDLRWGVYVVFEGAAEYVRRCFREYGLVTDDTGAYTALYRPYHLIGLELGVSVASVALRSEPTGAPKAFAADVVCVAKKELKAGDVIDGEGGATVWGRLMPAHASASANGLPIGLSRGATVQSDVAKGDIVRQDAVVIDAGGVDAVIPMRKELEKRAAAA